MVVVDIKKVKLFDKSLIKGFLKFLSGIELILSLILIFSSIPDRCKIALGIAFLLILIIFYICYWIYANRLTSVKLEINQSTVNVVVGDIFKYSGLKVIAFNEYFDTVVDNIIISESSLNGIFIKNKVDDIENLNRDIENNRVLQSKIVCKDESRTNGQLLKYSLGATHLYKGEYILTAFSHFTDDNRAYLSMADYLSFLISFWDELDRIYAGRSVVIPLFGSGITRFNDYDTISDQELLEILIWSYKISRVKFTYPSTVTFVIHESKKDKINFYKIKEDKYHGL